MVCSRNWSGVVEAALSRGFVALWLSLGVCACGGHTAEAPDAQPDGGDAGLDTGVGIAERSECENLNPLHCTLPYPSSRYLVDDATTNTGRRVDFPLEAMPVNQFGEPLASLEPWNFFDGFSPFGAAMTLYAGVLDMSNVADELDIPASLADGSPTVWLDAETGERVPHWAELDGWRATQEDLASFYLRPAVRLKPNHRYIIATRDLTLVGGAPVEPSEYFAALRDGTSTDLDELEARREHFEDIFARLDENGIARDGLIEAWDYWTGSDENLYAETLAMRDAALAVVGERGLGCTVDSVEEEVNEAIWRRVRGTFTVPLYMTDAFEGAIANRDSSGAIVQNGLAEANFEVDIPFSVRDAIAAGEGPQRGLMYGHGLLGDASQVGSGGTRVALARSAMVGFGTDFWGLSRPDEAHFVTDVVTQWGNFNHAAERLMQGAINSVVLARSFKGVCSELPELQLPSGDGTVPAIDTDEIYYYGISLGGIMGATLAALTPDIERFVLQVGGAGFSHLMRRSGDFETFELIFKLWYRNPIDRHFLITSTQSAWDRTDPATYLQHLVDDPLPGAPPKRICYQVSQYDTEVHNSLADMAVRTMGIPQFTQSAYEMWNPPSVTAGPSESGYVVYHLHDVLPTPFGSQPSPMQNSAHDDLRYVPAMLDQLDSFLRPDGLVESFCPADSCEVVNSRAP